MSRGGPQPTVDGVQNYRCMAVGLTAEQEEACKNAVRPVPLVRKATVAEACSSMSTVLPLVVIVDEGLSRPSREALGEFVTACGAELVTLEAGMDASAYAKLLFDAILLAERRRLGSART